MIQLLLLLALIDPSAQLNEGFSTLNPQTWREFVSQDHRMSVNLPFVKVEEVDLGGDQVLLLIRRIGKIGTTASFTLKEFEMGNPPQDMTLYLATWNFQLNEGREVKNVCLIAVSKHGESWSLSEIYCKEGP